MKLPSSHDGHWMHGRILPRLLYQFLYAVIILASACFLNACGAGREQDQSEISASSTFSASEPVTKQSFYFDTIVQITVYDMTLAGEDNFRTQAGNAINEAFQLCASYENLLSRTKEGTDIWNINHADGMPVKVDPETVEVIQKGIAYGDLSEGRFDITIGPAEDLWDFHSDSPHVPDAAALAEAIRHVDYTKIQIDADAKTVQLLDPDMEIDLGGIAKGYIADKVCALLKAQGVTSAIVSLGGNIETVGGKPRKEDTNPTRPASSDQQAGKDVTHRSASDDTLTSVTAASMEDTSAQSPFTIGIETPYSERTEITGSVQIMDGTVVTSGIYERHFVVDGKDYHHILDVKTGYPVETDVCGVTITAAAGHSVDADALSTICLILGSGKGKEMIEGLNGYEAAFILRDESVVTTSGMEMEMAE